MISAIEVLKMICSETEGGYSSREIICQYTESSYDEITDFMKQVLLALEKQEETKINVKKNFDKFWNENKKSNWNKDYDSGFSNGYQLACADLKELLQKLELYPKKEKELEGEVKK